MDWVSLHPVETLVIVAVVNWVLRFLTGDRIQIEAPPIGAVLKKWLSR